VSRRLNDEQLDEAVEQAAHNEVPLDSLPELITQLEDRMKAAAKNLEYEEAANLRDRIKNLRQKLVGR
jgi:excinuclease ABC subunit B